MSRNDKCELACIAIKATKLALLCDFGDKEAWIPQSLIDDDSEVYKEGDEGILIIPEWLALDKGLI